MKKARIAGAVGATVVGVAAGYVAGVLTAPAAGSKTRRQIARKIEDKKDELKKQATRTLKDAKATAATSFKQARTAATQAMRTRLRAV